MYLKTDSYFQYEICSALPKNYGYLSLIWCLLPLTSFLSSYSNRKIEFVGDTIEI